jgi:uncharacterized phiE125 gp8 family phage protein
MKAHLRVDIPDDDDLIRTMITAARQRVESIAYHRLVTQTLQLGLDGFPRGAVSPYYSGLWAFWPSPQYWPVIELEPPVQSVSSVQYLDPNGVVQTIAPGDYLVDSASRPCRLLPNPLGGTPIWPAAGLVPNSVLVTYVSGFGSPAAVPANLLAAVRLLVGHYYNNREQILSGTRLVAIEIPEGIDDLLRDYSPQLVA